VVARTGIATHTPSALVSFFFFSYLPFKLSKEYNIPLTSNHSPQCLASVNDPEASIRIVSLLPDINKKVLYYLVRFLQIVADPENQKKTKMTVNNLAMIFAPNFLRCESDLDATTMINNAKIEQDYVKNLILHLGMAPVLQQSLVNSSLSLSETGEKM